MTMVNSTVAMTISNMVDFGSDSHTALIALCAALVSIVVWAVMAWYLGYPTSESHSLIAGLTGAAIGLQGSFSAINGAEWIKVVYGLVFSVVLGFLCGLLCCRLVMAAFQNVDRRKTSGFFRGAPDRGCGGHGFYAWGPGWPEVHGRFVFGNLHGERDQPLPQEWNCLCGCSSCALW